MKIEDLSPLYNLTTAQPLALSVLHHALSNAAARPELHALLQEVCNAVISELLVRFQEYDAVPLLELVADLLPRLPPGVSLEQCPWRTIDS